jgi:hypothetical protein
MQPEGPVLCRKTQSWAIWIHSTPSHRVYWRYILVLSSHPPIDLQNGLFPPLSDNSFDSTPNIIAIVRHALLDECAVRAMRKKLKLSFDGGDFGSKKCKEGMVGSDGVWVWRESGVRLSVLCLCVWQESGFSRSEDVSTFDLTYFLKTLYKFCTFSKICKGNAAINCISVQRKKGSFSSTLMLR